MSDIETELRKRLETQIQYRNKAEQEVGRLRAELARERRLTEALKKYAEIPDGEIEAAMAALRMMNELEEK